MNFPVACRLWKKALEEGDRAKASTIVRESLDMYRSFQSQGDGFKPEIECLEIIQKHRKILKMLFKVEED
ncbi:hypothetical protein AAMO2058_000743400 [Amorphochlora amoebiformis]